MDGDARLWVLLGQRTGDNNQLLRLARELEVPFRTLELRYNRLHLLPPRLAGASLASLDPKSRALIAPPWPQAVLGIGHRSVPVALKIRELAGKDVKLVRLGNPRLPPDNFDLVITTPQYRIPPAPNVIELPIGISTAPLLEPTAQEREWLERLPRPHRLLLIGGNTFMWTLDPQELAAAAAELARKPRGSVIAVSSPRSSQRVIDAVAGALSNCRHAVVRGRFPRYPVLLRDADEIHVTADSVAMVSDAVATGKPVGLVLPKKTVAGNLLYGLEQFGLPVPVRDVSRFWTDIQAQGLAGTVAEPLAGKLPNDSVAAAAAAVKRLLA
jgi:mitochondrial fission protein ELM1